MITYQLLLDRRLSPNNPISENQGVLEPSDSKSRHLPTRLLPFPIPLASTPPSLTASARQAAKLHGGAPPSSMTSISRSVSTRDCDSFVPRSLPTYQGVRTRGDAGCPAGFAACAGGSEGAAGAAGSACCSKYLWRPTTLRYQHGRACHVLDACVSIGGQLKSSHFRLCSNKTIVQCLAA